MSMLEDFQKGIPLTPELERLKAGLEKLPAEAAESRTQLPPEWERQRLERLFDSAAKHATDMNHRAAQGSIDIGKERTQYFEKIALMCSATIALVVSFVGSHAGRLQPVWLLRSVLILLVLAMVAAIYRNWRFPFYVLAGYMKQELEAKQDKERCRRDLIAGVPTFDLEDGTTIDVPTFLVEFAKTDKTFDKRIEEVKKCADSAFSVVKLVERAALLLIVLAMMLLVALAWINF